MLPKIVEDGLNESEEEEEQEQDEQVMPTQEHQPTGLTEVETMGVHDDTEPYESNKIAEQSAAHEEDTVQVSAPSEQDAAREFNEAIYDEMMQSVRVVWPECNQKDGFIDEAQFVEVM